MMNTRETHVATLARAWSFIFTNHRLATVATVLFLMPTLVKADPCGMVPPANLQFVNGVQLKRIGVQKTYIFHKNGVETMVLHPGFSGNVDDFGMLIPFPAPPAIRKLPDNIFEQIANAIDPPEVVVDLRPQPRGFGFGGGGGGFFGGGGGGMGGMSFTVPENEVQVIEEKAVGMYEVAVLAAGSADALRIWMMDHNYRYPKGMDKTCNEYVAARWFFVAVKTKVKQKAAADPKPGQREIKNDLPEGASFDGYVQAMGFRFAAKEPVIPMRLSVFNEGDSRNVVFMLTDEAARIKQLPTSFVKRQLSGERLIHNLTKPLPLRVIGGQAKSIPRARRALLSFERDPTASNAVAAELIASDIVACKTRVLTSETERLEAELLQISEELDLRGQDIDDQIRNMFVLEQRAVVASALKHLKGMTLTVIDGDFSRDVLRAENLTLASYQMPAENSRTELYDAKILGPQEEKKLGKLYLGHVDFNDDKTQIAATHPFNRSTQIGANGGWGGLLRGILVGVGLVAGLLLTVRSQPGRRVVPLLLLAIVVCLPMIPATASKGTPTLRVLVKRLGESSTASDAANQLAMLGEEAVPALIAQTRSKEVTRQGWAIVALSKIGSPSAEQHLKFIHTSAKPHPLVKTWVGAAIAKVGRDDNDLVSMIATARFNLALARTVTLEVRKRIKTQNMDREIEELLVLMVSSPETEEKLVSEILQLGSEPLIRAMVKAQTQPARRKAAGYVATLGSSESGSKVIGKQVAKSLRYNPMYKEPIWLGGPLFLPAIKWQQDDARSVVRELVAWRLWAELNKDQRVARQLENNLRNVQLAASAKYKVPNNNGIRPWLKTWKEIGGNESLRTLLASQGAVNRFSDLLD